MKICSIENCGQKHRAKGLCYNHYQLHYAHAHKEEKSIYNAQRYLNNREEFISRALKYAKSNREKISRHQTARRKTDACFKLGCVLRTRVRKAVKNNQKSGSVVRDMGCTVEFLKKWLESQMEPWMNWDNWKLKPTKEHPRVWHVDHKKPLSFFDLTDRAQFLEAAHYTNLQPLESTKNLSKGAKL